MTGLDISPTGLRLAQNWLDEEYLEAPLVQADNRHPLPFKDGAFEGLLSTQVIHHALLAEVRATIPRDLADPDCRRVGICFGGRADP